MSNQVQKISTLALVLLVTGAIDSIRNLPATALFGPSLPFFFILSAVIFLIPVALVSAELAACWADEEGGIYHWVRLAFNDGTAFLAIWLQWINTLVWYPTILSFIAGTTAYLIKPELANNKLYLMTVIISCFWGLTVLNLKGIQTSARFAGVCTVIGMIIPMGLIIILALLWMASGQPLNVHFTAKTLLPAWNDSQSFVSLTAIMTAFLGMELAAVHVKSIDHPQKNFPRAMFFSVVIILFTMIFGSLAIAIVLPTKDINLVSGVMQAFHNFLAVYHLAFLQPVIVVMLLLGSLGGLINWIISPAKGLLQASIHGYLPNYLCYINQHGVPSRLLIVQAIVVSILGLSFLLVPSVNGIYWLFTDLSTELYMCMYVLMFIAAIRLKQRYKTRARPYSIPGGKVGYYAACGLGLIGCIVTIIVGFIPPEESINIGSRAQFQLLFSAGLVLMMVPALLLYIMKKMRSIG